MTLLLSWTGLGASHGTRSCPLTCPPCNPSLIPEVALSQETFMSWTSAQVHPFLIPAGDQGHNLSVFPVTDASLMF